MYLSNESLEKIVDYFKNLQFSQKDASSLTLFLLFKAAGISNKLQTIKTSEWQENFENAVNLLMSFYAPWEKLPKKYYLVFPFDLTWRKGQSGSIGDCKRWIRPSNIANLLRNAPEKYNWISIERENEEEVYRLSPDYLNALQIISDGNEKLDINYMAGWALKYFNFKELSSEITSDFSFTKVATSLFQKIFNITPGEERTIFFNAQNMLDYSEVEPDFEKYMREKISYMDDPAARDFTEDQAEINISGDVVKRVLHPILENISLEEVKQILLTSYQIILFGPPGTGKTFTARNLKQFFDDFCDVQFHPNYGYEEFIGAIRPEAGKLVPVPGILTNFLENKVNKNPNNNYLLIIDEINRGNLSKIFGEVISCLDRDSNPVILAFDPEQKLSLPTNLFIVGTMNSTDRSIAIVDYALRRRFEFIRFSPDIELLKLVTNETSPDLEGISIINFFSKINEQLHMHLGKEFCLGHTYFMPKRIEQSQYYVWTIKELERTFNYSILPIIEEYCFENEQMLISIFGNELPQRLKNDSFKDALQDYLGV